MNKLLQNSTRLFSSQQEIQIDQDHEEPVIHDTEKKEFKAETKKLLDIVAKSIYTDKEVFIRELLSNCSDALEKQRYNQVSGQSAFDTGSDLFINVITNPQERTITFFDSGVGMTRDDIVENLGTIAKSGSQKFIENIKNKESDINESIIGQFGVGFYSTFVVSDMVEVFSKQEGHTGVRWVSDGHGEYELSDVENLSFERGTKIVLKLRPDTREFSAENEVEKVIKKFSQFITYPIKLNGQTVNSLQAIWQKDKREVTKDEYERFFETMANTKVPYKYMLHYSTDIPLSIKALLYVPSTHNEKMGMMTESSQVNLYSKKVLIKENCQELFPGYLRFIKGVVDCEDLPLNISRENYQDSSLISKLRNVMTRRVLKMLDDEAKRDPETYNKWYEDFQNFLKEGLNVDQENSEALFKLLRFQASFSENKFISLEDYIGKMIPGQENIYFIVGSSLSNIQASPFMQPFKDKNAPPVLLLTNNIDEFCFQSIKKYKEKNFVNIETSYEQIAKDLGQTEQHQQPENKLPEDDVTNFCLWLKNDLSSQIAKVSLSKRLKDTPAIVVGEMSSSMRMMMQMMEQQGQDQQQNQQHQKQTLEINPGHPIIVNLNNLRKNDPKLASLLSHQMLDNVLVQSGIPYDIQKATSRTYEVIDKMLDAQLEKYGDDNAKQQLPSSSGNKDDNDESVLKKAHRDVRSKSHHTDKKIVEEFKVK